MDFLKEGFSRVRLPFHVCETLAMRGEVGVGTSEVADRRFAYHIDDVSCLGRTSPVRDNDVIIITAAEERAKWMEVKWSGVK